MKKRYVVNLLAGLGIIFFLLACGSTVEPGAMTVGDELEVELSANPSTGYEWRLHTTHDAAVIELDRTDYTSDSDAVGSGGTKVFVFKAVGAGSTQIALGNYPPGLEEPDSVHTVDVTVTE